MPVHEERWLPVVGYPGYEVSSSGQVRCWNKGGRGAKPQRRQPRICAGQTTSGYHQVKLRLDGKPSWKLAHRLVLEAFAGPCPEGMEACHNNGVRTDNRPENLRWDTRSANHRDKHAHGTSARGEASARALMTNAQVAEVAKRLLAGETQSAIARSIGVSASTINLIANRKTWTIVTGGVL